MKTIDRLHHLCLTVSSENFEENWPKVMGFFTDFLGMTAYRVAVEEMDQDSALKSLEEGMGLGKQVPQVFDEDGHMVLEYFYYLAGEDLSEAATVIDLIVFLTDPGQRTQPHDNLHTLGLRGFTLLVDNVDAIYQRGMEEGREFVCEPKTLDWGSMGEVRYAVVKDPSGNHIELVQTNEVSEPGTGKALRVFSINQNTADLAKALDFYSDDCGMSVEARVEQGGESFAGAMGVSDAAQATTCYLKGSNPDAKTYYALTQWDAPTVAPQVLKEGHTTSYFRMWHWIMGNKAGVQELWDKMEPKMQMAVQAPYTYPSPAPWGEVTMAFFVDQDGVLQEFANHADGTWHGLQEIVDHEDHRDRFTMKAV